MMSIHKYHWTRIAGAVIVTSTIAFYVVTREPQKQTNITCFVGSSVINFVKENDEWSRNGYMSTITIKDKGVELTFPSSLCVTGSVER
jgi:hypothetical protein